MLMFDVGLVDYMWIIKASKTMTTQKKKDLRDQYQVADLREYDVMHTHTTAYPTRRAVTGEQWSEKLGSKECLNLLHLLL